MSKRARLVNVMQPFRRSATGCVGQTSPQHWDEFVRVEEFP